MQEAGYHPELRPLPQQVAFHDPCHLRRGQGITQEPRELLRDIIRSVLAGRDVFAVMPTGGGKSLCYQLPAMVMPGAAVVISPLISLMKDQVDAAVENGIPAAFMNSSMSPHEISDVYRMLQYNKIKLLYIAPERFVMPHFLERLKIVSISLFAIDEAHCISEWGHDFRPDYLSLSLIPEMFPDSPIAAFTATATRRVQEDIIQKIGLRKPPVVRASFVDVRLAQDVSLGAESVEQVLRSLLDAPSRFRAPVLPHDARVVTPGRPEASTLLWRIRSTNPRTQMPPLGVQMLDRKALALLERWITERSSHSPES